MASRISDLLGYHNQLAGLSEADYYMKQARVMRQQGYEDSAKEAMRRYQALLGATPVPVPDKDDSNLLLLIEEDPQ